MRRRTRDLAQDARGGPDRPRHCHAAATGSARSRRRSARDRPRGDLSAALERPEGAGARLLASRHGHRHQRRRLGAAFERSSREPRSPQMVSMALKIRPLHESFGAEITGVDIGREPDSATMTEIEAAWYRHSILLFRNVQMTPAQHVAFTRRLGPLHIMEPPEFNLPGYPEVLVVSNVVKDDKPVGIKRAGWGWHSDGEDKAIPNAGSFLYAMKLPPADGDTLYADTYAAFAALPDDVRRL